MPRPYENRPGRIKFLPPRRRRSEGYPALLNISHPATRCGVRASLRASVAGVVRRAQAKTCHLSFLRLEEPAAPGGPEGSSSARRWGPARKAFDKWGAVRKPPPRG